MGLEHRSLMGDLSMCFLWRNSFTQNLTKIYTFYTILRQWTAIILIYIHKLPELAPMVNLQVKIIHMKPKPLPEPEHILFVAKKHKRIAPKSRADGFRQHLENKTGQQKVYAPVGQQTPWK